MEWDFNMVCNLHDMSFASFYILYRHAIELVSVLAYFKTDKSIIKHKLYGGELVKIDTKY